MTWLWMLGMCGGATALALVSDLKPYRVRLAVRRAIARDTLALRGTEKQPEDRPGGPIERVERAHPVASALLLGLFMAGGTWLYRLGLLDVARRYDPLIHLIGPLGVVAGYLYVRKPTVGEKVDKGKEDEEGAKFALNLFLLVMFSLVLMLSLLLDR